MLCSCTRLASHPNSGTVLAVREAAVRDCARQSAKPLGLAPSTTRARMAHRTRARKNTKTVQLGVGRWYSKGVCVTVHYRLGLQYLRRELGKCAVWWRTCYLSNARRNRSLHDCGPRLAAYLLRRRHLIDRKIDTFHTLQFHTPKVASPDRREHAIRRRVPLAGENAFSRVECAARLRRARGSWKSASSGQARCTGSGRLDDDGVLVHSSL